MTKSDNPTFVFIHGAWHDHHTWDKVVNILSDRGYGSVAIDLPGAGVNAAIPESFNKRPLDAAAFATEPSPNAGVTQDERTKAAIDAVAKATTLGNGKVVLVGHSLGGLTLNHVGESEHNKLHAIVYLTAFMLPNGTPAGAMIAGDEMATSLVPTLFMADPETVGALRSDVRSPDAEFSTKIRETFYGDVSDEDFISIISTLHPDEPAQVAGVPSPVTAENFGTISRHFIRCTQDRAVVIPCQDKMIELVDAQIGSKTHVHNMDTSHSPFLSQPEELSDILISVTR